MHNLLLLRVGASENISRCLWLRVYWRSALVWLPNL